jgi:hypothetical protein
MCRSYITFCCCKILDLWVYLFLHPGREFKSVFQKLSQGSHDHAAHSLSQLAEVHHDSNIRELMSPKVRPPVDHRGRTDIYAWHRNRIAMLQCRPFLYPNFIIVQR